MFNVFQNAVDIIQDYMVDVFKKKIGWIQILLYFSQSENVIKSRNRFTNISNQILLFSLFKFGLLGRLETDTLSSDGIKTVGRQSCDLFRMLMAFDGGQNRAVQWRRCKCDCGSMQIRLREEAFQQLVLFPSTIAREILKLLNFGLNLQTNLQFK